MSLLGWAVRFKAAPEWRALQRVARDPLGAQTRLLRAMVARDAATAFGKEHGFARIGDFNAWRAAVPVREYEGLRPWLERAVAGEPAVLTSAPVLAYASTSGTTGAAKLIPCTEIFLRDLHTLTRVWLARLLSQHARAFDRGILTIVSPALERYTALGVPVGAMSGIAFQRIPAAIKRRYIIPQEVSLIEDHEARYFTIARLALAANLSFVSAANPSTLQRLDQVIERNAPALIRAIHDGALGIATPALKQVNPDERHDLMAALGLRPDPKCARELEAILARESALRLGNTQRDIVAIACWLGGSAGRQASELAPRFPGVPWRDVGLIASEGRFTIPLVDGTPAGVLAATRTLFEFIAEDEVGDPNATVLGIDEIEAQQRYGLVVTAANGLWRYDLNDIVQVEGFLERLPIVSFVRKGRDMLSITGEKLHLNHVLAAVATAEREVALSARQFQLICDVEQARYDLALELPPQASADIERLRAWLLRFERGLADANDEYRQKRASQRLGAPRLALMQAGWAEALARELIAGGRREAQFKWPYMAREWHAATRAMLHATIEWERSDAISTR